MCGVAPGRRGLQGSAWEWATSTPGLAAEPANYAAQGNRDLPEPPERWHGKPQTGSVCLTMKEPQGLRCWACGKWAWMLWPLACQQEWVSNWSCAGPPGRRERVLCSRPEVSGASGFQDAHSRNSSEPATLVCSPLVSTAPGGMLISCFSWLQKQESQSWLRKGHPERAR